MCVCVCVCVRLHGFQHKKSFRGSRNQLCRPHLSVNLKINKVERFLFQEYKLISHTLVVKENDCIEPPPPKSPKITLDSG